MHDDRQRIDLFAVDQHVDLDHVGGAVLLEFVVHRRVTARGRFHLVEKIEHHLIERQLIGQLYLAAMIGHVDLVAALVVAQGHDRADILLRHEQLHRHDRFFHRLNPAGIGQLVGIVYHHCFAIFQHDLVHH